MTLLVSAERGAIFLKPHENALDQPQYLQCDKACFKVYTDLTSKIPASLTGNCIELPYFKLCFEQEISDIVLIQYRNINTT